MDLPSVAQRLTPEIQFLYERRRGKERLGLESTRRLLELLGEPQRDIPVLHVAGTNGKGSTTALAAALLQSAGLRVGRFTSPHILGVEERISVDGDAMDPDVLRARIRDMRAAIESADASFFESITALAACAFRDAHVDVAVYEVGLGGRLDSTNALPAEACVITGVGHDHEAILGRGLRAIAAEKLGIARPNVPLFAALTRQDLVEQARAHCEAIGAPLHLLPPDAARVRDMHLDSGMRFDLELGGVTTTLGTRFFGAHQARNTALAALAVGDLLRRRFPKRSWDLVSAVADAFMPGRFQVLPAVGGEPTVVLDVAHNPESLRATLDIAAAVFGGERAVVVLGMLRDKRLTGVIPRLRRVAKRVILTRPNVARSWDPHQVAPRLSAALEETPLDVESDAEAALSQASSGPEPVLVLGSHYLIGELIPVLARRRATPAQALVAGVAGGDTVQATG